MPLITNDDHNILQVGNDVRNLDENLDHRAVFASYALDYPSYNPLLRDHMQLRDLHVG